MHNCWTSLVLFSAVCGLSSATHAAEEPLSYAVGDKCYCNLSASSSLHNRMVGSPVGGQSVKQVCDRIGEGPELIETASGNFNFRAFDDMQCGHGPGLSGFKGLINNSGSGSSLGPKWDLASAYAEPQPNTNTAEKPIIDTTASAANDAVVKPKVVETPETTVVVADDVSTQPVRRLKPRYVNVQALSVEAPEDTATVAATGDTPVRVKPSIKAPEVAPVAKTETPSVVKPKPAAPVVTAEVKTPVVAPVIKPVTKPIIKPIIKPKATGVESLPLAKTEPLPSASVETTKTVTVTQTDKDTTTTSVQALPVTVSKETQTLPVATPEAKTAQAPVNKPANQSEAAAESVANAPEATGPSAASIALSNALKMPTSTRESSRNFEYLSVIPMVYDYGGNGVRFSASSMHNDKLRFVLRAALARTYQEGSVGASYVITPPEANRLTFALTAGVEYGRFSLEGEDVQTSLTDTGLFAQAKSRFVVNNRFELQAGVGFSSFFEGDPHAFGAALYHLTSQVDLTGEFEVGDNDSLGLGVRFYY